MLSRAIVSGGSALVGCSALGAGFRVRGSGFRLQFMGLAGLKMSGLGDLGFNLFDEGVPVQGFCVEA